MISLSACTHVHLQGIAYSRIAAVKKAWRSPKSQTEDHYSITASSLAILEDLKAFLVHNLTAPTKNEKHVFVLSKHGVFIF